MSCTSLGTQILLMSEIIIGTVHVVMGQSKPNVLIFMVDDLGIGDIGCYGNTTIDTPNIDRLCHEGVKMTHHLAAAPMCTPSRAAFLTGRYPARFGMVGEEGTPRVLPNSFGSAGLPTSQVTWVKKLSDLHGYSAGLFGKWHQGWDEFTWGDHLHGPLSHGFSYFYGLSGTLLDQYDANFEGSQFLILPDRTNKVWVYFPGLCLVLLAEWFLLKRRKLINMFYHFLFVTILWFVCSHYKVGYPYWWRYSPFLNRRVNSVLFRNKTIVEQPIRMETLSDRLVEDALGFLDSMMRSENPFVLFYSFPQVHTPLFPAPRFQNSSIHGPYGDSVVEVDNIVGKFLDRIDELQAASKFIVYFTSDHGGHREIGHRGGHNGIFSGGKGVAAYEGGIRVPGLFRWTNTLGSSLTVDQVTSHLDFFPTIIDLIHPDSPGGNTTDGFSIRRLLTKEQIISPHSVVLHHCAQSVHGMTVVKEGTPFKIHLKRPKFVKGTTRCKDYCPCYGDIDLDTPEVFDLISDPSELRPLSNLDEPAKSILETGMSYLEGYNRENKYTPSQFKRFFNIKPYPWLQACCSIFFCQCTEEK